MIINVGEGGAGKAQSVKYDNSTSKLSADNVQGAIDELTSEKVDKVSGKSLSTNDYTTDEKNKLAGIAEGANKTIVDTSLSTSSTNPVQNKVVASALNNKVSTVSGKGLSTNDYTTTEKQKLSGIATGATKNVVDSSLSTSSTNAVQNKVVATKINEISNSLNWKLGVENTTESYFLPENYREALVLVGSSVDGPKASFVFCKNVNQRCRSGYYYGTANYGYADVTKTNNQIYSVYFDKGVQVTAYMTVYYR